MTQSTIITETGTFEVVVDVQNGSTDYEIDIKASETVTITEEYPCYVTGTLIRTARGEVAVEALEVGDVAVTASGEHRPIRWIGHRTVDCRRHPDRDAVLPVRILADAFGRGLPERDLYVSAGHSVGVTVFDEVMIPAGCLVNGATVARIEVDEVTYWHVELDSHDMLVANGLPAESYNDVGNRGFFAESPTVGLAMLPDAVAAAKAATCVPFYEGGAMVAVVRERMRARALALGWSQRAEALGGLHVLADGVRIEAQGSGMRARFVVPAAARDVRLVSGVSAQSDFRADGDPRRLGVCLGSVAVSDGLDVQRALDLAGCPAEDGFHHMEPSCRWTTGSARLPVALWDGCREVFFLTVDLVNVAPPRWVAPVADAVVVPMRRSA